MKPYGHPKLKGISGRRRSKDTPHRRRSLRIDKKRARRAVKEESKPEPQRWTQGYSTMDGQPCTAWFNVTNWH